MKENSESKAITTATKDGLLSEKDVKILVASGIIPSGTPSGQILLFGKVCSRKKLDPFCSEIHLTSYNTKDGKKFSIITGIDGRRIISSRTGQYAGNDDYLFDEGFTVYQMIQEKRSKPKTATATIYRMVGGQRCPFTATVRWEEYVPTGNKAWMWNKMPFNQLGKTAEALAHRKGFPEEQSGIYSEEEMDQSENKEAVSDKGYNFVLPADKIAELKELILLAKGKAEDVCKALKVDSLESITLEQYELVKQKLSAITGTKEAKTEIIDAEVVKEEDTSAKKETYAEKVEARLAKAGPQKKSTTLPPDGPTKQKTITEFRKNLTKSSAINDDEVKETMQIPY